MRSEARIFNLVGAFLFLAAGTYAWWTEKAMGVDWTGTVALVLSGTLCAMCGFYFGFVARRIPLRPEDRSDGEIEDAAGEVGFFSPHSYWPFGIAVAAGLAGTGLVYRMVWLIATGLAAVVVAVCGLLFEYYTGTRKDNGV